MNSILLSPVERSNNVGLSGDVRDITYLNGTIYGVVYGTAQTVLCATPLFGTSSDVTLSDGLTNVKGITNDGTYLYAVEEQTGGASGTSSRLAQIATDGSVTFLQEDFLDMRSVVYDGVNAALYVSCPFDNKIIKATGGNIGNNDDTFVESDFITLTNNPGRLWLQKGSIELFFTLDSDVKSLGASFLSNGVPTETNFIDFLGEVEETTCLIYFDEFDCFLYSGENNRENMFGVGLFSLDPALSLTMRMGQAIKLGDNSFVYPDGNKLRYVEITKKG